MTDAAEDTERIGLGPQESFPLGRPVATEARGWKLLVFRHAAGVSVLENRCTHAATRLDTGRLKDCVIICPLHRARFDLRDGAVLSGPARMALRRFPAGVEDGSVVAELPERPGPPRPPSRRGG